jgi:hypothetical protein
LEAALKNMNSMRTISFLSKSRRLRRVQNASGLHLALGGEDYASPMGLLRTRAERLMGLGIASTLHARDFLRGPAVKFAGAAVPHWDEAV